MECSTDKKRLFLLGGLMFCIGMVLGMLLGIFKNGIGNNSGNNTTYYYGNDALPKEVTDEFCEEDDVEG